MLALKDLLSGGKKADTMDAGSAKPTRRKSMACLRMIPRNIVARKRSVFLDHHPVLTDWQEPREDAPDSGTSPGTPSPKSKTRGGEGHQSSGEGEGKGEGDTLPEDNGRCAKAAALEGPREVISLGGVSGASPSIPTSISTAAASSSTAAAATSSSCSTSANTPTRRRIRGSEVSPKGVVLMLSFLGYSEYENVLGDFHRLFQVLMDILVRLIPENRMSLNHIFVFV